MVKSVRRDIYSESDLLDLAKFCKDARQSHRIFAIRDILLGEKRSTVCERYGIRRENLRHWVVRYNACGVEGLRDEVRSGRPKLLAKDKLTSFKKRVEMQPDIKRDGYVRWRAVDIQKVLREEYGVIYTSLYGVRRLCKSLGLSYITARPTHPKHDAKAIEDFKKNSQKL